MLPLVQSKSQKTRKPENKIASLQENKKAGNPANQLKITKGELVRCAIHLLNRLYEKDGEASDTVQSLKRKKGR